MVRLPKLMLGAELPRLIQIAMEITEDTSDVVECNAEELTTAEPVALCLLASAFAKLKRVGRQAVIRGLRPEVRKYLEEMDVLAQWFTDKGLSFTQNDFDSTDPPIQARRVSTSHQANEIANALTSTLASFVPLEDQSGVLDEDPELAHYRAVERPLGYLMSELLDNAVNHARGKGFGHSSAWVAAQYYRSGDLVRVCVLDDGCGFLGSLRNHREVTPKTDAIALSKAFNPFVSCKADVGIFKDSVHQGIGLTVCRDLCLRAGGRVDASSGTAWVVNPGTESEKTHRLHHGYQGSIVNLAFHRRAITAGSLGEILSRYQPTKDLPIRFI